MYPLDGWRCWAIRVNVIVAFKLLIWMLSICNFLQIWYALYLAEFRRGVVTLRTISGSFRKGWSDTTKHPYLMLSFRFLAARVLLRLVLKSTGILFSGSDCETRGISYQT